jgi:hypothetical protein
MTVEQTLEKTTVTDSTADADNQAQTAKTFTQEEVNAILARTKSQLERKFASKYEELGDPEELRTIKTEWEKKQQQEQIKRGEFEKTLQELAAKKDAEIQRRDAIIKEYKVNTPILEAAAKHRAVAPEQVKALLSNNVRLNDQGEVEVVGSDGAVRYRDNGTALAVEDLVSEFLSQNPHFVNATPATTNAKSSITAPVKDKVDITKLDMTKPEHRALYKEYRKTQGLA